MNWQKKIRRGISIVIINEVHDYSYIITLLYVNVPDPHMKYAWFYVAKSLNRK